MFRIFAVACLVGSVEGHGKGKGHGKQQSESESEVKQQSAWTEYLEGLNGAGHKFDWMEACESLGQTPAGYSMSMTQSETTFQLTCDTNKIEVVCDGTVCSSDYEPPESASDVSPTGDYSKEVRARADESCRAEFTDAEVQEILDLHNKMRCAVGSSPVSWDADLECQAQKTQDQIQEFEHSECYDMDIPAGENLATGEDGETAVWMWFTEYLQSGGEYKQSSYKTGHYTAMVWESVKTIGCGIGRDDGSQGVIRCQYSGGSDKSNAPNMGGKFEVNVPQDFVGEAGDFETCGIPAEEVKTKASLFASWGILTPTGTEAENIGLFSTGPTLPHASPIAFLSACAFAGTTAMLTVGLVLRRRSSLAAPQGELEPLAVGEA